jgi:5-methylcytosine-specific restriction endonuclease McrA
VLKRESVCHLCGELVDFNAAAKSSRAPSVDHIIPLAQLKLMAPATFQAMASDPNYCRLAHIGCNSGRRERPIKRRQRSRPARDW